MKKLRRGITATTLFLTFAALVGCDRRNGETADAADPVDALSERTISSIHNASFWGEQRRAETEVWNQATAYCDGKDGNLYPNCRPVLSLLLFERTLDRPAAASSGFDVSIDMRAGSESAKARMDSLNSAD